MENLKVSPTMETPEFYHALFNNYMCGMIRYYGAGKQMRIISVNQVARKMYGVQVAEDYYEKNEVYIGEYTADDYKDVFVERLDSMSKAGDMISYENLVNGKDGEQVWVSGEARLVSNENGQKHIVCILIDESERKRNEENLKAERDKYNHIFQNLPCGILQFTYGKEIEIINYNQAAWKILNYKNEREFKQSTKEGKKLIIYEEDIPYVQMLESKILRYSRPFSFEHRIVCSNGEIKWLYGQIEKCTALNMDTYFQCAFIENTAQREAQLQKDTDYKNEVHNMSNASNKLISKYRFNITQNTMEWYKAKEEFAVEGAIDMEYDQFLDKLFSQIVDEEEKEQGKRRLDRKQLKENFDRGQNSVEVEFRRNNQNKKFVWMNLQVNLVQEPNTKNLVGFAYTRATGAAKAGETTSSRQLKKFYNNLIVYKYNYVMALDFKKGNYDLIYYNAPEEHLVDVRNSIDYIANTFYEHYTEAAYPYIDMLKDNNKLKRQFSGGNLFFTFNAVAKADDGDILEHTIIPADKDNIGNGQYFLAISLKKRKQEKEIAAVRLEAFENVYEKINQGLEDTMRQLEELTKEEEMNSVTNKKLFAKQENYEDMLQMFHLYGIESSPDC